MDALKKGFYPSPIPHRIPNIEKSASKHGEISFEP